MRAAGVKREYGCCIFRFRIFLTSYTRRTGNAAKAGHMRAKARLSAFKKRFFVIRYTAASRRAAPHIRRIRWHTALYTGPPARRRQPIRACSYGEASSRSTSIARRAFAFVNALPTRAAAAPSLSRGIRTAACRICISSGSSKKAPDALQILLFFRLKNRLPARIITVTV